jgi:hypothetical protein
MKFAIILAGIVVNIIIYDGHSQYTIPSNETIIQSNTAEIGDEYNGTNFLYNEQILNAQTNEYYNQQEVR